MIERIYKMVKARLTKMNIPLDDYLKMRIESAIEELAADGIYIRNNSRDIIFVTDIVCWQYKNRDDKDGMPDWLKESRRQRWLAEATIDTWGDL